MSICRVYRLRSGDYQNDFEKVVEVTFPRLLSIAQGLVNETSEEAGEMLHLVLKAYKHASFVGVDLLSDDRADMDSSNYPLL